MTMSLMSGQRTNCDVHTSALSPVQYSFLAEYAAWLYGAGQPAPVSNTMLTE